MIVKHRECALAKSPCWFKQESIWRLPRNKVNSVFLLQTFLLLWLTVFLKTLKKYVLRKVLNGEGFERLTYCCLASLLRYLILELLRFNLCRFSGLDGKAKTFKIESLNFTWQKTEGVKQQCDVILSKRKIVLAS